MRPQFLRARGLAPTFIGLLEGVIILFKALGKVLSLRFEKLCLLISSSVQHLVHVTYIMMVTTSVGVDTDSDIFSLLLPSVKWCRLQNSRSNSLKDPWLLIADGARTSTWTFSEGSNVRSIIRLVMRLQPSDSTVYLIGGGVFTFSG